MTVTRHISLDNEHVERMKPFLEKHHGNFGDALKEIINISERYARKNSSAIDLSLFNWALNETEGILVPDSILDETIDPVLIHSMGAFEEYLRRWLSELEWSIEIFLKYDHDSFPSNMSIEIKGSPQKIRFAACLISQYLVKNSLEHNPLEIKNVIRFNEGIKVGLTRSNKNEAQRSLVNFFGERDEVMKTIKSKPAFWKAVINRHLLSNYNMVTVHRNYFEDLLADKVPLGEITIENLTKKPLHEIPLKEMLSLIKEVYETSKLADRVEINRDTIALFHSFRNNDAVDKLKKSLVMLLEANGHLYDATSVASTIVLRHRKDVGIKINEIVDTLKMSSSTLDQELIVFMAFLKGLKEIPDVPLSLSSLGRRIGASLMEEYEREHEIKNWNIETFKNALETIDSRLHRESEWKLEGNNLLYTIKKCNLATEGNTFDSYVCHTTREAFKGALNYTIGKKAELNINKLLSHGDNFCEVVVRIS